MTNERAAEILDPNHREHYESIEPVNEACRMGRDAILRRIAQSPYPDDDADILACPSCGSGEYLHNDDGNPMDFCGQCGQAIDWGIEENPEPCVAPCLYEQACGSTPCSMEGCPDYKSSRERDGENMSTKSLVDGLRYYAARYESPPYGRVFDGIAAEHMNAAANEIERLLKEMNELIVENERLMIELEGGSMTGEEAHERKD